MARKKSGFYWALVLAVAALAFMGGSVLYHDMEAAKQASSQTLSHAKEAGEEGWDKISNAIDEARKKREAEEAAAKKAGAKKAEAKEAKAELKDVAPKKQ